ncbi:DNA-directed RNA polymerase II subunit RPB1 [Striga asiatica]|uniref:DNA-directed RNA polymerase II subunit RPB1 n=1 Tax=Striga asiatica TaxID=4170 RepID=A0A5A7R4P2_STRAF|nr:DNA-directed RNA polymerase II subunit RPB1 [Striga asiatica]
MHVGTHLLESTPQLQLQLPCQRHHLEVHFQPASSTHRPLHTLLCLNIFFKKYIIKTTVSVPTCTKVLIHRLVTLILKHTPISITYRHTPITITYRNTPITYNNTSITYRNTPITYTPISCFLSN